MKKQASFYVKFVVVGLLTGTLAIPLTSRATQEPSFRNDLIQFSLHATNASECRLFSPQTEPTAIEIRKRPKSSAKGILQVPMGTACRIIKTKENRQLELWMKIEIPAQENQTKKKKKNEGWVLYDQVITAPAIFPLGGGKNIFLSFRPSCENKPCAQAHWLVTAGDQRPLDIGSGQFAFGPDGDTLFYDRISHHSDINPQKEAFWRGTIFRYDIPTQTLTNIGRGVSPAVHPTKKNLYFRDFQGQVYVSDFSGKLKRILFTPKNPARLYIDAQGQAFPLEEETMDVPIGGSVTGPLEVFVNPADRQVPPPVKFLGTQKIRLQVLYAGGEIQANIDLPL